MPAVAIAKESPRVIKKRDFKLIRKLGSGSYAIVTLVDLYGKKYALKQVSKQKLV